MRNIHVSVHCILVSYVQRGTLMRLALRLASCGRIGSKVPAFMVWPGLMALALLWMAPLPAWAASGPPAQAAGIVAKTGRPGKGTVAILRVPEDYPTIHAAVDAAKPYALISLAPGIYHEVVTVH